jgi:flagellar basal-body rod protein FlgG
MGGLIDAAGAILSTSTRRLEIVSNNVANAVTPGFKRQLNFSHIIASASGAEADQRVLARADTAQGKISPSANPLDLAISGPGFFQLSANGEIFYTRQGQFLKAEDGALVTPLGHRLQQAGGGDIVVQANDIEITADGTILEDGRPTARIALYEPADQAELRSAGGSLFGFGGADAQEVAGPQIRQGALETSNVALGDEMVAMMAALRQAESGARLVQVYDDLLGRAITTFGQGGR